MRKEIAENEEELDDKWSFVMKVKSP